jgi:hypothetical protein
VSSELRMKINVVEGPWSDEEMELIKKACKAYGVELTKNIREISLSDEEMELVRNACKAQVTQLGKLLHDAEGSNDQRFKRVRYEYDKYKEFYQTFGGEDPI